MHPIFDGPKLKWTDPSVQQLHSFLAQSSKFKKFDMIELLYDMAGDELPSLTEGKSPLQTWKEALNNLHGNGYLRAFCEKLREEGRPQPLMDVLAAIFQKQALTRARVINDAILFDRGRLSDQLDELAKPNGNKRVVIVRGGKKTGKSHGRLLFIEVARDNGGTPIIMQKGQVTVIRDVLDTLFGPLGGLPDSVLKRLEDYDKKNDLDTTDFAWLAEVGRTFLNTALSRQANLWIAMDNLGIEKEAWLLPQEIKLFFDKLILQMASLAYHPHVRLMLIDYPEGALPPDWAQLILHEDRIAQNDVEETHLQETIESWCRLKGKNLHEDERRDKARSIIIRAEEEVAKATQDKPAYRIELIAQYLQEYLNTVSGMPSGNSS